MSPPQALSLLSCSCIVSLHLSLCHGSLARKWVQLVLLPQCVRDNLTIFAQCFLSSNPLEALPANMPFPVPPLLPSLPRLCLSFECSCVFALRESALFSVGSPCIGAVSCAASLLCLTLFSFLLMRPMLLWQKN